MMSRFPTDDDARLTELTLSGGFARIVDQDDVEPDIQAKLAPSFKGRNRRFQSLGRLGVSEA